MIRKILTVLLFLLTYTGFFCFGFLALFFLSECVHNAHLSHHLSFIGRRFQFDSPFIVFIPLFFSIYAARITTILAWKKGWTILRTMNKVLPIFWSLLCLIIIVLLLFIWWKDFSYVDMSSPTCLTSSNPFFVTLKHALLFWVIALITALFWFAPNRRLLLLVFPAGALLGILDPRLYLINQELLRELAMEGLPDIFPTLRFIILACGIWFIASFGMLILARYLIRDKALTDRVVIFGAGIWLFVLQAGFLVGTILPWHRLMIMIDRQNGNEQKWSIIIFLVLAMLPAIFLMIWGRHRKTAELRNAHISG